MGVAVVVLVKQLGKLKTSPSAEAIAWLSRRSLSSFGRPGSGGNMAP